MLLCEVSEGCLRYEARVTRGYEGTAPVLLSPYGFLHFARVNASVAFSRDDGATWDHDWIVRDDGPDDDLGYPSTVELGDGSLFTVCYQKAAAGEKCSLLWSKWRQPA